MNRTICFVGMIGFVLWMFVPLAQGKDPASSGSRWSVATQGVLKDSSTGLQWTQTDNGKDIEWKDAGPYCESLTLAGGHWRLPSVDELAAIYDENATPSQCGVAQCKTSTLFQMNNFIFWSGTPGEPDNGPSRVWIVTLNFGKRLQAPIGDLSHGRALCVQPS